MSRIQLRRRRGWRKPAGSMYVGRPSRWGNPFTGPTAVEEFKPYARIRRQREPGWLEPLRGRDLLCWCPEGQACHADVLLELANR